LNKVIYRLEQKLNIDMDFQIEEKVREHTKKVEEPLHHQIHELKQEVKEKKEECYNIKNDYGAQFDVMKRENEKLHSTETEKLKKQITQAECENSLLTQENEKLTTLTERLDKDLERLQKQKSENVFGFCNPKQNKNVFEVQEKEIESLRINVDEMKARLLLEQEHRETLLKKHTLEYEKYKSNVEMLRSSNAKLKEQVTVLRQQLSDEEKKSSSKLPPDEIVEALKKKLIQKERDIKGVALDLIEESRKLDVISDFQPTAENKGEYSKTTPRGSSISPDKKNMLHEVVDIFKVHLDYFRNYCLTLQGQNERFHLSQSGDESFTTSSPVNSQTSAKLLRHLQNRVQQLRQENAALKQDAVDSPDGEVPSESGAEKKIEQLELTLQKFELETQKNTNLLYQKNTEVNKLKKILSQATKENLRLEKEYSTLQQSMMDNKQLIPNLKPSQILPFPTTHVKALGPDYHGTFIQKLSFPMEYVPWNIEYPVYYPAEYTSDKVMSNPTWADNDIRYTKEALKFNELDDKVDRTSHLGTYQLFTNGVPRNPIGRTGMTGRGLLGRWGPNHAADPIVTRWSLDAKDEIRKKDNLPVLEFVAIKRRDTSQWAIPGGMVDPGENVSATLKREFGEEALNSIQASKKQKEELEERIEELFENGITIYKGYVDDPRNTDNAWMETVAVNFHDEDGSSVANIPLNAGDDAKDVRWLPIDGHLNLYASHFEFIKQTCIMKNAYFAE